ncbi:MAG: hypothetical protein ACRDT4_01165 [Micromonosporaceae bacterium]
MSLLSRIAAGFLFLWALVLFFSGPELSLQVHGTGEDDRTLVVRCDSLSDVPQSVHIEGVPSRYEVIKGSVPEPEAPGEDPTSGAYAPSDPYVVPTQLDSHCDHARTSRAAGIGLLAVPIALLALIRFPSSAASFPAPSR